MARKKAKQQDVFGSEEEKLAYYTARWKCRSDLQYLCYEVLNMPDLAPDKISDCHKTMIKTFKDTRYGHRTRLLLDPRGHLKSSIYTVGGMIQNILRTHGVFRDQERELIPEAGEEWCQALGSWDLRTAQEQLGHIRKQLEQNERLKILFPDIFYQDPMTSGRSKGFSWGKDSITVIRKKSVNTPTVMAFSIQSLPTGFHFNRICLDDMVTKENVNTKELMDKTDESFAQISNLKVQPSDCIDICGTRYHFNDQYGRIIDTADDKVFIQSTQAIIGHGTKEAKPLWPERFTMDDLKALERQNAYVFWCQQMNQPRTFSESMDLSKIRNYSDKHPCPDINSLNVFIAIDPAVSKKEHADYTAAVALGVDSRGRVHMLGGIRERLSPTELGPRIARFCWAHKPASNMIFHVSCERVGFQAYVSDAIRRAGFTELFEHSAVGKKEDRINKIFPAVSAGKVWMPKEMVVFPKNGDKPYDVVSEWRNEAITFPKSKHDDLLDATAAALSLAAIPDLYEPEFTREDMADHESLALWERAHMSETAARLRSTGGGDPDELWGGWDGLF